MGIVSATGRGGPGIEDYAVGAALDGIVAKRVDFTIAAVNGPACKK